MLLAVLILAIVSIVFTSIEGFKAWGVAAPIGFGIGFGLLTLVVPYGSIPTLIACVILFNAARKSRMAKIAAEPDSPEGEIG